MTSFYWVYTGYTLDEFYGEPELLRDKYAQNSNSVRTVTYSYNGLYQTFRKSVFATEADKQNALAIMFGDSNVLVFQDDVSYYDQIRIAATAEKRASREV